MAREHRTPAKPVCIVHTHGDDLSIKEIKIEREREREATVAVVWS